MIKHLIYITLLFITTELFSQLVINPGGSITVSSGTSLYVGTNLYIDSDASGTGHFADQNQPGNITITGNVAINQYLSANGWHNTSAPINNAESSVFSTTDLVFYYDETIILNDWNFGWVWHDGSLDAGRGYDVFSDISTTVNYQASSSSNLNTGAYSTNITRTDVPEGEVENRKGWNLLGNPYPSPVDWLSTSGWTKTNINDAKYIWNPANNNYTIFIGGSNPTGTNGGTRYIPANQGFWVQATQSGTFAMNNSTRVGVAESTPGYYKNQNNNEEIRIIATANGYTDETLIRTINQTTFGFDVNNDASKLFSFHDSVPQIYTVTNNNLFSINSIPVLEKDMIIRLNFECNATGYYSISLSDNSNLSDATKIFLIDNELETFFDLSNGFSYNFHYNNLFSNNRFSLVFNSEPEDLNKKLNQEPFFVASNKNTLTILRNSTEYGDGLINIYSINGKNITTFKLQNNTRSDYDINISSGWYIASIIVNNKYFNYKFFVKN